MPVASAYVRVSKQAREAFSRVAAADRLWTHVPTPGDHYSPATGSAVMTVISQMTREHERAGGQVRVLVSEGTWQGYEWGERVEVPMRKPPTRPQKIVDAAMARVGLGRPFANALYRPFSQVIPPAYDGLIFVHNGPAALGPMRRRHPNARLCLWVHNALFRTYSDRQLRQAASAADRILCCSAHIANSLQARLGSAASNVRVVPNGVDLETFFPAPNRVQSTEPPLILFAGRILPEKGVDLLVRAAHKLLDKQLSFRLRIVGSSNFNANDPLTPFEKELRRLAQPLGNAIEFVPFVPRSQIVRHFHEASIFTVPSNWDEPFGLTVAEGMACGLPLVVSRRGGIPEVGGDSVFYFDPPNTDALAEQLAALLGDASARASWGARALTRARELSWPRQYQKLRKALQD